MPVSNRLIRTVYYTEGRSLAATNTVLSCSVIQGIARSQIDRPQISIWRQYHFVAEIPTSRLWAATKSQQVALLSIVEQVNGLQAIDLFLYWWYCQPRAPKESQISGWVVCCRYYQLQQCSWIWTALQARLAPATPKYCANATPHWLSILISALFPLARIPSCFCLTA